MRRRKPAAELMRDRAAVPPRSHFAALAAELKPPDGWVREPSPPQPPPEEQIAAWRNVTAWRMWKDAGCTRDRC